MVQQNEEAVLWILPRLAYGGAAGSPNQTSDRNGHVYAGVGFITPARFDLPPGYVTCLIQRPMLGRADARIRIRNNRHQPRSDRWSNREGGGAGYRVRHDLASHHLAHLRVAGFRAVQRCRQLPDPRVLGPKPAELSL